MAVNSVVGKGGFFKEVQITFILKIGHTLNVIMSNKCDYHTLIERQKNRGEPRQPLLAKASVLDANIFLRPQILRHIWTEYQITKYS